MNKKTFHLKNHFVSLVNNDDSFMKRDLINTITDKSILYIAIMTIPLNVIIYLALMESEYMMPRFVVPLFSLTVIIMAIFRKHINYSLKIWILSIIFFLSAVFALLLGLLDMASLWFVVTMIYILFVSKKYEALYVFIAGLILMMIAGYLLITKISFIPLKYNFENCHYACVITRIIHYIMVGYLLYYIIGSFMEEITQNINELNKRASDLETVNKSLQKEMKEKKAAQQLALETSIITEERERKRIAADLHDGLGPVLSSINLYYQAYIDEKNPEKKVEIEKKLKTIIGDAVSEISRISHNISPSILENNGLVIALENFINQININKNFSVNFSYQDIQRFDIKKELAMYRAITELINNTIKHAKASIVNIKIYISNGFLQVNYSDNGKGFNKKSLIKHKGIGLQNIKTRLQSLGGTFSFNTSKNNGFQAVLIIPYN